MDMGGEGRQRPLVTKFLKALVGYVLQIRLSLGE